MTKSYTMIEASGVIEMRSTRPLTISLPHDMAEMVRTKVASGEYASESEVIRDGLRTLPARDAAVERWLREEVAQSYDEHHADPQAVLPGEELMTKLRASHRTRALKPDSE
jgi:antitoxin ParD1/3/4